MYCRKCGHQQKAGEKFCPVCGTPYIVITPQAVAPRVCKNCGATLSPEQKFCPSCGAPYVDGAPAPVQPGYNQGAMSAAPAMQPPVAPVSGSDMAPTENVGGVMPPPVPEAPVAEAPAMPPVPAAPAAPIDAPAPAEAPAPPVMQPEPIEQYDQPMAPQPVDDAPVDYSGGSSAPGMQDSASTYDQPQKADNDGTNTLRVWSVIIAFVVVIAFAVCDALAGISWLWALCAAMLLIFTLVYPKAGVASAKRQLLISGVVGVVLLIAMPIDATKHVFPTFSSIVKWAKGGDEPRIIETSIEPSAEGSGSTGKVEFNMTFDSRVTVTDLCGSAEHLV